MILRRGKQPSAVDCLIHENVAVVIVLLAIKAAILAMKKTGQNTAPADRMSRLLKCIQNFKYNIPIEKATSQNVED